MIENNETYGCTRHVEDEANERPSVSAENAIPTEGFDYLLPAESAYNAFRAPTTDHSLPAGCGSSIVSERNQPQIECCHIPALLLTSKKARVKRPLPSTIPGKPTTEK